MKNKWIIFLLLHSKIICFALEQKWNEKKKMCQTPNWCPYMKWFIQIFAMRITSVRSVLSMCCDYSKHSNENDNVCYRLFVFAHTTNNRIWISGTHTHSFTYFGVFELSSMNTPICSKRQSTTMMSCVIISLSISSNNVVLCVLRGPNWSE